MKSSFHRLILIVIKMSLKMIAATDKQDLLSCWRFPIKARHVLRPSCRFRSLQSEIDRIPSNLNRICSFLSRSFNLLLLSIHILWSSDLRAWLSLTLLLSTEVIKRKTLMMSRQNSDRKIDRVQMTRRISLIVLTLRNFVNFLDLDRSMTWQTFRVFKNRSRWRH